MLSIKFGHQFLPQTMTLTLNFRGQLFDVLYFSHFSKTWVKGQGHSDRKCNGLSCLYFGMPGCGWVIVNLTLRNKFQLNFNRNSNIFIQEIVFENVVCEMASILSRKRWVNIVAHLAVLWTANGPWFRSSVSQWVINYHQHNYHQQKMAASSSGKEQRSMISLFPGLPDSWNLYNL